MDTKFLNKNEIGNTIKKLRKGKMTQKELATKINKTESSIRKYENGSVQIPLDVLEKIAVALDVTPFEIAGWPYYDTGQPNMANSVKVYESFHDYIASLGYTIQIDQIDELQANFILIKDGKSVTFTNAEFEQFQEEIKNSVDFQIWKKKQDKS